MRRNLDPCCFGRAGPIIFRLTEFDSSDTRMMQALSCLKSISCLRQISLVDANLREAILAETDLLPRIHAWEMKISYQVIIEAIAYEDRIAKLLEAETNRLTTKKDGESAYFSLCVMVLMGVVLKELFTELMPEVESLSETYLLSLYKGIRILCNIFSVKNKKFKQREALQSFGVLSKGLFLLIIDHFVTANTTLR